MDHITNVRQQVRFLMRELEKFTFVDEETKKERLEEIDRLVDKLIEDVLEL